MEKEKKKKMQLPPHDPRTMLLQPRRQSPPNPIDAARNAAQKSSLPSTPRTASPLLHRTLPPATKLRRRPLKSPDHGFTIPESGVNPFSKSPPSLQPRPTLLSAARTITMALLQ
jgi:hypothetical protein